MRRVGTPIVTSNPTPTTPPVRPRSRRSQAPSTDFAEALTRAWRRADDGAQEPERLRAQSALRLGDWSYDRSRTPRRGYARACERCGVARLRVFGSILTDHFDPDRSDVDFLVDFLPGRENAFRDYFDLKSELERIVGREVDLIVARSVRNPFFKASAFGSAQELLRPDAGAHLWDAREAAKLVRVFSAGRSELESNDDLMLRSAIERQLEILGEAPIGSAAMMVRPQRACRNSTASSGRATSSPHARRTGCSYDVHFADLGVEQLIAPAPVRVVAAGVDIGAVGEECI